MRVHADFARAPVPCGGVYRGGLTADLLLQQLSAAAAAVAGKPFIYDIKYACVRACNIYIFFSPRCCGKRHKSVRGYFRQGRRRRRHGRSAPYEQQQFVSTPTDGWPLKLLIT